MVTLQRPLKIRERGATLIGTLIGLIILGVALTIGFEALTMNQRVARENLKIVRMQSLVEGFAAAQAARRDITPTDQTIYVTANGIAIVDPGPSETIDVFRLSTGTSVQAGGDVKVVAILSAVKTNRSVSGVAYFHR